MKKVLIHRAIRIINDQRHLTRKWPNVLEGESVSD